MSRARRNPSTFFSGPSGIDPNLNKTAWLAFGVIVTGLLVWSYESEQRQKAIAAELNAPLPPIPTPSPTP
jgi:hypothetical protein